MIGATLAPGPDGSDYARSSGAPAGVEHASRSTDEAADTTNQLTAANLENEPSTEASRSAQGQVIPGAPDALRIPRGFDRDRHRLSHLPAVRGDVRARAHARGRGVSSIRGDAEDVFSHGFICPKGFALKALHEDPDRVRTPLIRTGSGLRGGVLGRGLRRDRPPPRRRSSRSTAATPSPSTSATRTPTTSTRCSTARVLVKALGTRNVFSATTVDQMPKHVSAGSDVRQRPSASRSRTWTAPTTC